MRMNASQYKETLENYPNRRKSFAQVFGKDETLHVAKKGTSKAARSR